MHLGTREDFLEIRKRSLQKDLKVSPGTGIEYSESLTHSRRHANYPYAEK